MANRKSKYIIILTTVLVIFAGMLIYFWKAKEGKYGYLTIINKIDPDIVLINIGNADRGQIAELINKVNECGPKIIAIDVVFEEARSGYKDSLLIESLKETKNDIIAYRLDSSNIGHYSFNEIKNAAMAEGYTNYQNINGLAKCFYPALISGQDTLESFALKVAKGYKAVQNKYTDGKEIEINYNRMLAQYLTFYRSDLENEVIKNRIRGKIALLGYFGPENEDKHHTPLRYINEKISTEPDTYGIVIIANEIRTILGE